MMRVYANLPKKSYEKLKKRIEDHPEDGRTMSEFISQSVLKRLAELGKNDED